MTYLVELNSVVSKYKSKLAGIKLVAFDVDGVLTSGQLQYGANGEVVKTFSVKDGVGLKVLTDIGVAVAVVSAKDSPMVAARMDDLGVNHYFPGTKDKLKVLSNLAESLGVKMNECCFVGDDMVDLSVMSKCGVSMCPNDAYPLVQESAQISLTKNGGEGAARLAADIILVAKGEYESAYKLASLPEFERSR
jgi:3-deoxy-D-manno-octulosonate 8-phosphate phosphatase (KDO 8-P phosphatase)